MLKTLAFAAAVVALAPAAAPTPEGATLTIHVSNVRNARGRVHVDLCDQAHFLRDGCPISLSVAAQSPVTTLVIRDVPPGRYAAQLFHDENANDKMDRGLFGLPKEGVAFSRDAPIHLSPPKWADAVFVMGGAAQAIPVTMRYFMGATGPQAR